MRWENRVDRVIAEPWGLGEGQEKAGEKQRPCACNSHKPCDSLTKGLRITVKFIKCNKFT